MIFLPFQFYLQFNEIFENFFQHILHTKGVFVFTVVFEIVLPILHIVYARSTERREIFQYIRVVFCLPWQFQTRTRINTIESVAFVKNHLCNNFHRIDRVQYWLEFVIALQKGLSLFHIFLQSI